MKKGEKGYDRWYPQHKIITKRWARTHVVGSKHSHKTIVKRPYPSKCEICGRPSSDDKKSEGFLHYHHWDNMCPSVGVWLCFRCHRLAEAIDSGADINQLFEIYRALKSKVDEEWRPYFEWHDKLLG